MMVVLLLLSNSMVDMVVILVVILDMVVVEACMRLKEVLAVLDVLLNTRGVKLVLAV